MKICIYGAGAVGGFIGTKLAHAGYEVSAVARGATLEALREYGLRLQCDGRILTEKVRAVDDPAELGVQDLIILAVKAPALADVSRKIPVLIGPDTVVLTAMNGISWWFFDGFGGEYAGSRLVSVDPDGLISAGIPTKNVLGCVVHGSFSLNEPGFFLHGFGKRLIIGEPGGNDSIRAQRVARVLAEGGMDIEVSRCIQTDIWYKLWGNMTMNPVSAITGATCDQILDDPLVYRFCLDVMAEAARIGARIGCPISQSGEERSALTRQLGAFKTSMLQDVEAGRGVELDALVSAVREIGQMTGEVSPNIDALLGLARLNARIKGLYPTPGNSG